MGKVLHLDMDSFFATVEQQARPHLRGRPVAVTPADSPGSTIVAASIEAKRYGIGTGSSVAEARLAIPGIVLLPPDPSKYRQVHRRFRHIIEQYGPDARPRSVDEISLWLAPNEQRDAKDIGAEIKQRIRDEVGEWLSASVGIGPNWLLAKTASNIDKPDGLFEIDSANIRQTLGKLRLRDLCGIAHRTEARMILAGITTPLDLYDLHPVELKRRLGIIGYYWHLRLHGYAVDTQDWPTRSLGHSSVLPRPTGSPAELKPLLHKLCQRVGRRLRQGGWLAERLRISGSLVDAPHWHHTMTLLPTADGQRLFQQCWQTLTADPPPAAVNKLAVTTFQLRSAHPEQLPLFDDLGKRRRVTDSVDAANDRWGELTVHPAGMLGTADVANDAIAFGQDLKLQRESLRNKN